MSQPATPTSLAPRSRSATSLRRRTAPAPAAPVATLPLIMAALADLKAVAPVSLSLVGKSSFTDTLVIASGTSSRHLASMADAVAKALAPQQALLGREGDSHSDWICLDAGSVVVHLFLPTARTTYNLEKLWSFPAAAE